SGQEWSRGCGGAREFDCLQARPPPGDRQAALCAYGGRVSCAAPGGERRRVAAIGARRAEPRRMRVLLQRVARAEVRIREPSGARVSGRIDRGFVLLVGFTHVDDEARVAWMAEKVIGLRLFADADD